MNDYEEMQRMLSRAGIEFALDPAVDSDNIKVGSVLISFTNAGVLVEIGAIT